MEQKEIDFLALGDIVTDAFIRIKDAKVHCDVNRSNCELCVRFGDKIPYEAVYEVRAVGNSPNAAVSAHRLGLNASLITDIGNDRHGEEIMEQLTTEGIDLTYVRKHEDMESNYHYVLWYEEERTILVKHQTYPYQFPSLDREVKWLYLSSLAENSLPYHEKIADFLEASPHTKLAFQPGTFQMKLGKDKLKRLYQASEIFFCNREEAKRILKTETNEIKDLLTQMRDLGPKIVVITDGPKGAYVFDGETMLHGPMYPDPKPPVDRTGAGDSFSSTFTAALALGETLETALLWGPINSMSVVQEVGAQKGLLSREKLENYLKEAPKDYTPKNIG